MTRLLFTSLAALLCVLTLAAPAPAQDPTETVQRIGKLPGDLIAAKKTDEEIVDSLFLATLVRLPKENEKETALKHLKSGKNRKQAASDVAWALVMNKEFLKIHGLDKNLAESLQLLNKLVEEWEKEEKKEEKK